jgi:hypothetical protein
MVSSRPSDSLRRGFQIELIPLWVMLALGVLFVVLVTWVPGWLVPVLPQQSQSVAMERDLAHALFAADRVLAGEQPHRDFFWHYGLLPLHTFALFCKALGGVSLEAYQWHERIWGLLAAVLSLALMIRVAGRFWGSLAWLLTGFGWCAGGQIYMSYERCALLAIGLCWQPPDRRARRVPWLVGMILGLMQFIKFGTAFLAGVSWLLIDMTSLLQTRAFHSEKRRWLWQLLQIFVAFFLIQGLQIAHAFASLPSEMAKETLLPLVHLQWYASYVDDSIRWPQFINWNYFLGFQMPLLIGLLGIFVVLVVSLLPIQTSTIGRKLPAALLGFIYTIGVFVSFKHVYNMIGYGWLVAPGIAALLAMLPHRWLQVTLVLLLLPSGALLPLGASRILAGTQSRPGPELTAVEFPNGQKLWLTQGEREGYQSVFEALAQHSTGASQTVGGLEGYVFIPMGSGMHFFGRLPMACRHSWFFPGTIRPFERDSVLNQMLRARAVVVHLAPEVGATATLDPSILSFESWRPFRHEPEDQTLFAALGTPQTLLDGWLVFPVLPSTETSAVR